MECFAEYTPLLWAVPFTIFTFCDVVYFMRHVYVTLEVFLVSRPLYTAVMRIFNKTVPAFLREHDIDEEDVFVSRVLPHEVDHTLSLTDQAGALILELARNRALYSTWLISSCWACDTSLWLVARSQVRWKRRPRLLEGYKVRTIFCTSLLHSFSPRLQPSSRYVPIKQVLETGVGEVLCEADVTLALSHSVQIGTLLTSYRTTFGEYRGPRQRRSREKRGRSNDEQSVDEGNSGDSFEDNSGGNKLRRCKSYGNFLGDTFGRFSDVIQSDLSGL